MKPDSAVLQIASVIGTDTMWYTYSTAQSAGCGTNFSTSLLVNPILSPATMQNIADQSPTLLQADSDTVVLEFAAGANTYSYFVEKRRWLIVRLAITGGVTYDAGYYYADSGGIPALQMVAIALDTSLQKGGVRFKGIRLNQPLHAVRRPAPRRNAPRFVMSAGRIGVSGLHHVARGGDVAVRDAAGRRLFSRNLPPGAQAFAWDGRSGSGRRVAAGAYVLELSAGGVKRFYPFVLER